MAKRQLVHSSKGVGQQLTSSKLFNKLRDRNHRHFCSNRECRLVYEDCCSEPETNGLCQLCRGLRRTWSVAMDPRECCLDNCKQVLDPSDLLRYILAGPGPWYQCKTCARTHGWPCTT